MSLEFHHLKIAFYAVLALLATALVSLIAVLVWAFTSPRSAWDFASRYFLPADLTVTWEKIDFRAQRNGWKHWDAEWTVDKLKIEKKSPAVHAPVERIQSKFSIELFAPGEWIRFKDLSITAPEKITFKPSADDSSEAAPQSPFQQLQDYLGYLNQSSRWAIIEHFVLRIDDFELQGEAEPVVVKVEIQKPSVEKTFDYSITAAKDALQASIKGWVDANLIQSGKPFLKTDFFFKNASIEAEVNLSGVFDGARAQFDGSSKAALKTGEKIIKAEPKFKLSMTEKEAVLESNTAVSGIPGPLATIDDLKLAMRMPMDNGYAWSERASVFHLSSKLDLFFIDKDMRPPLEKTCRCKIPEKLLTEIEGRFYPQFLLSDRGPRKNVADIDVRIESLDNKLFLANLAAHIKVDKDHSRYIIEPRFDSQFEVRSFQGLRQFLDAKNIIVPSPLDVLDGTIKASARASVDHNDKLIKTPVEIAIELKSQTQTVSMTTTLMFELTRDFKALDIYVQALIKELKVELPPLDPVLGIPAMTRDSRVLLQPPKEVKPEQNAFRVRAFFNVKTVSAGSVKLLSRFADPYVPITLDMNNNAQGESSGFVRFEPFAITYLRRRINVERLQITLSEDDKNDFPVGGRFRIDQTSYKIFADVGGTTSSPIVQLNSEPFLPRNEIISVLLYNRTSDSLVSADSETVGSFEAALADRAIGLFGLWAFASTPIRSFSYNAVTHVYTATVELADGLTAGVGTNWERNASLEVRKRVSRRWVLTASWSPNQANEQIGKLVLQWEKRF